MSHSIVLAGPAAETARLIGFWVLAIVSVGAALGMVLARKAVHCAVLLAVVLFVVTVHFGTSEQGVYVPPRYEGGHVVPGHIEPGAKP